MSGPGQQIDPLQALASQPSAPVDPLVQLASGQQIIPAASQTSQQSNGDLVNPAGAFSAAVRNATNAATFNLADPAAAALAATFPKSWSNLGGGIGLRTSDQPTYGARFSDLLHQMRGMTAEGQESHPIPSFLASVGGAMLNPMMRAIPVPSTMLRSMGLGAALGGAYGAGGSIGNSNGIGDTALQTGMGMGGGAIAGVGTNLLGRGAGYIANKFMGDTPSSAASILAQNIDPSEATDLLSNTDKPLTLMDVGGDNSSGARLGRMLVTMPGQQSNDITDFLQGRSASQADRLAGDISWHLANGENLDDLQSSLIESQKANAAPLYQQAFAQNQNISSPEIDKILMTPAGKSAMKTAATMMQNDRTLMGVSDPDLLEQAREGGTEIPWKGGVASGLKLRSLDYVKQALDDQVSAAYRAGQNGQGRILSGLTSDFRDALDDADTTASTGPNSTNPGGGLYAQARAAWAGPARSLDAMTAGQSFLKPGTDIAGDMSDLSSAESQLYKVGAARALQDKVAGISDNRDATTSIFGNPAIRSKIASVFGPKAVDQFSQLGIQPEKTMQGTKNFVLGGSQTVNKLGDMAAPKGWAQKLGDMVSGGVGGFMIGGPSGAAAGALGPITSGVKDATSGIITNMFPGIDADTATKLGTILTTPGSGGLAAYNSLAAPAKAAVARAALARTLMGAAIPGAVAALPSSQPSRP